MTMSGDSDVAFRALRLLAGPAYASSELLADLAAQAGDDPCAREAVRLARTVSGRLAERERRERELTALYATAGDLSSLRGLEQVLQAIVTRARGLLGTEAAYLMLIDERRGDTYVRVTDGISTDAFKAARLAFGAGLGGLVAQNRKPYATPDYPNDGRFLHTVDAVVNAEGLVAVLGVPLLLREKVIGVLFAANRRERPFADEEIALLISLATHAAIAIETASLFDDVRVHSELLERAAALHERLTAVAARGGRLPELAAVVAEVLGAGVAVVEPGLRVLATARMPEPEELSAEVASACHAAMEGRATAVASEVCATPVIAGSRIMAVLAVSRGSLTDADLRTLERAALVAAILLLTDRQVAEAEQRVRGDLLADLFADVQPDPDGLRRRARLLGADLDRQHTVVVARPERAEDRQAVVSAMSGFAAQSGGLCGEHGRAAVALIPGTEAAAVACRAGDLVRRAVPAAVTVGLAGPADGPARMRDAYRDAHQCVAVLCALDRGGEVATPADLGVFGLLLGPAGADRAAEFVRRTLGPLLDYDRRRGSDLLGTIEAYFAADGIHARAAAALFIHNNTLYQRIGRINELLGDGWRSGQAALQVQMAVTLHRIAGLTDR